MTGIGKVVVFADWENNVVVAEHVVFEDGLKGVGMDGHPLDNNRAQVVLVEADSMEVGFAVEMKSALEDLR